MRECGATAVAGVPASAGLADVVFRRAEAEPGAVMLRRRVGGGGWREVTAAQFRAEVAALAGALIGAGIEPGDRVAVMSRTMLARTSPYLLGLLTNRDKRGGWVYHRVRLQVLASLSPLIGWPPG